MEKQIKGIGNLNKNGLIINYLYNIMYILYII